jgi:hypothetical protein
LDTELLETLVSREDIKNKISNNSVKLYLIDYNQSLSSVEGEIKNKIKSTNLSDIIKKSCEFMFTEVTTTKTKVTNTNKNAKKTNGR